MPEDIDEYARQRLRAYIEAGGPLPTWPELQYRLTHCDECWCHFDEPKPDCPCVCHGSEGDS